MLWWACSTVPAAVRLGRRPKDEEAESIIVVVIIATDGRKQGVCCTLLVSILSSKIALPRHHLPNLQFATPTPHHHAQRIIPPHLPACLLLHSRAASPTQPQAPYARKAVRQLAHHAAAPPTSEQDKNCGMTPLPPPPSTSSSSLSSHPRPLKLHGGRVASGPAEAAATAAHRSGVQRRGIDATVVRGNNRINSCLLMRCEARRMRVGRDAVHVAICWWWWGGKRRVQ